MSVRTSPQLEIPSEILEILGEPPLLPTENKRIYYATLAQYARVIRPGYDLFLWELIKDLTDSRTEITRYRRMKAALIPKAVDAARLASIPIIADEINSDAKRLKQIVEELPKAKLEDEKDAAFRDEIIRTSKQMNGLIEFATRMSNPHIPTESDYVTEGVFKRWENSHGTLDLLLSGAEKRFRQALADIERYKGGLGSTIRKIIPDLIDGECVDLEEFGYSGSNHLAAATLSPDVAVRTPPFTPARRRRAKDPAARGSSQEQVESLPNADASCV